MIRDALNTYALASAREWETDRSQTIGASEIGQCARKTFFAKNEGDHVYGRARDGDFSDRWGARVRGSVYENHWWEPALRREFGDRLLFAGADQRTFVDGFLSATPDGLIVGLERDVLRHTGVEDILSDCLLVECKTADPRTRLDEAKPEHVYQVQVQMGLVRARTSHRPSYALLSYTDTSFWDEVREFPVKFDPAIFSAAQARAVSIMTATDVSSIRPEGVIAGGRECEFCPFTTACGRQRAARVPEASSTVDRALADQIAAMARDAKELKTSAAALEQDARELEHQIRDLLAASGTRRLSAPGVSVTWSPVKGRPAYDMKGIREAAAAAGVDLSRFETVGDPTDRLVITISEGEGANSSAPSSCLSTPIPASAGIPAAVAA
ncbi:MAG TPA: hypothetical protein VHL98_10990 [Microvirga sp.]|jgi:hypothetical protein|nr:hypothetical protein [Microvirga sp.]